MELRRTGRELPSRTADNLFWLGRYVERAEGGMRQVRSSISRLVDDERPHEDLLAIDRVLRPTFAKAGVVPPDDSERAAGIRACLDRELGELVFDADRPYGLRRTLRDLGRTASLSRDRLSGDSWRILRSLQPEDFARRPSLAAPSRRVSIAGILGQLDQGIQRLAAFSGMGTENMTRSFGWHFLDMGRRIERCLQMTTLLESLRDAGEPEDDGSLLLMLDIADSFMTYRSRYLLTPQLAPVLDLLLLDETNPRSVAFQLEALDAHLEKLPRQGQERAAGSSPLAVHDLLVQLRLADVTNLCRRGRQGNRPGLEALLGRVVADLPQLTTSITRTYFSHAEAVTTVSTAGSAPAERHALRRSSPHDLRYSQPVSISHHVLHLVPRRHQRQVLHATSLSIEPHPAVRSDTEDYFGNPVTFLTIEQQHEQLVIESRSLIDVVAPAPGAHAETMPWDRILRQLEQRHTR